MGTECSIEIINEDHEHILTLIGTMDGYFKDGVGDRLCEFLNGKVLVNGLSFDQDKSECNGMGDLAIQLAVYLRGDKAGGWYISSDRRSRHHYPISHMPGSKIGLNYSHAGNSMFKMFDLKEYPDGRLC